MKTRNIVIAAFASLLMVVSIGANRLMAQASAGPLPPRPGTVPPPPPAAAKKPKPVVPARTSLEGPWKLNREDSDDPRRKVQDSRGTNAGNGGPNGRNGGNYPGGGYPGGGYPGGGYPPGGYPGGGGNGPYGGNRNSGRNTEDDERLEQLLQPPTSLTFSLKNPVVEVVDEHFHKLTFYTDGRQLQKPKKGDDTNQEIAAHWSGSQLITDEKTPQGAKMSRTFELSADGRQFFETFHIDRGKSKGMLAVRYVYDVAGSEVSQGDHESDPEQPVLKRKGDTSNNASSPQGAAAGQDADSNSSAKPQDAPAGPDNDPNKPVLKRHFNNISYQ